MSKSRVTGNYCAVIVWLCGRKCVSLYHGKYIQDTHIRTHGAGSALLSRRTAQDGLEETEGVDRLLSTPERETGPAGKTTCTRTYSPPQVRAIVEALGEP